MFAVRFRQPSGIPGHGSAPNLASVTAQAAIGPVRLWLEQSSDRQPRLVHPAERPHIVADARCGQIQTPSLPVPTLLTESTARPVPSTTTNSARKSETTGGQGASKFPAGGGWRLGKRGCRDYNGRPSGDRRQSGLDAPLP